MRAKCAIALVPLLAACGVTAGCSSGSGPVARVSDVLNCGRVVDPDATGYLGGGPLTVSRAVGMLTAVQRAGGAVRIPKGRLNNADLGTLDVLAVELMGYSGNKLSADAAAFAQAELSYSPNNLPIDTSYAGPLEKDIAALGQDCPSGLASGAERPDGGS
jgi:hypothetical protein